MQSEPRPFGPVTFLSPDRLLENVEPRFNYVILGILAGKEPAESNYSPITMHDTGREGCSGNEFPCATGYTARRDNCVSLFSLHGRCIPKARQKEHSLVTREVSTQSFTYPSIVVSVAFLLFYNETPFYFKNEK